MRPHCYAVRTADLNSPRFFANQGLGWRKGPREGRPTRITAGPPLLCVRFSSFFGVKLIQPKKTNTGFLTFYLHPHPSISHPSCDLSEAMSNFKFCTPPPPSSESRPSKILRVSELTNSTVRADASSSVRRDGTAS